MATFTNTTASPILKEFFDPRLVEAASRRNTTFSWFLKKARKEGVNGRGYLFTAKTRRNQGYGTLTSAQEGGLMPIAGTPGHKKVRADYISAFMAGEMSGDIRDAPDAAALVDMAKAYMADAEESFTTFQDLYLFGNGSGSIAVATTAYNAGTPTLITCALAAATPYGATKLAPTMRVQFIDPANGNQRTGGSVTVSTITAVDSSTDVVTFDAVPTDVAINDIIVIENTYGRQVKGFDYHINDSNGNWLPDAETGTPIPKATNPWTKGVVLDASAATITAAMIDTVSLRTQLQTGDGSIAFDAVMISHPAQMRQYMALGTALSRTVNLSGNKRLDLGFGSVSHNGMEWRASANCQPDRIYGLQLSDWVMPMVKMPQMYKFGDTGSVLSQKPGSAAFYDAMLFYVYARYNVVCQRPYRQWMIKNIGFTPADARTSTY